jgi:hypothetical protein
LNPDQKLEALRTKCVGTLKSALFRPEMYTACDRDLPLLFDLLLDTALFIDGVPLSIDSHHNKLSNRGLHNSPLGLPGDLAKRYTERDFHTMIAAMYIPFAHQVGYIDIESQLSKELWGQLRNNQPSSCRTNDISLDEITSHYGTPSLRIGGTHAPVLFFVGPNADDDWIVLHFANPWIDNKPVFGDNPKLSSLWLPTKSFARGLVFTPFGILDKAI